MITFEVINNQNLNAVKDLLLERNKTIPEYVDWKYEQKDDFFRGAIAFVDGQPAGCFGLIPRELELSQGKNVLCGWFADWYVSPKFRCLKIGKNLLNEISSFYPITFGHPGPQYAQLICKQNGFREISFQSRRRLILKPWDYARFRTHNPLKILSMSLKIVPQLKLINSKSNDFQIITNDLNPSKYVSFVINRSYQEWIYSQPISQTRATREWKQWEINDFCVFYAEDFLKSGERRCLLLYFSGELIYSTRAWRKFFSYLHENGIIYVDTFTTRQKLDEVWHSIGAQNITESPILVKNLQDDILPDLYGWDRENWMFLASKRV